MHLTSHPDSDGSALQQVKAELCERLWLGVVVLVVVVVPISVARAWNTGWMPVYSGQVVALVVLVATFLLRHKLPVTLRAIVAIACLELGGASTLLRMGFLSFSALWLVAGAYVIGVLYGWRAGLLAVVAHLLVVAVMMSGYLTGMLALPVDADDYMRQPWSWLLFGTMMAVFPWMLLYSIGLYKQSIVDLLRETERQRAEIERLATHDPLTGLVQQHVLNERLEFAINRARSLGRSAAVLFIDLDGFKQINDRFGHAAGDHLLHSVALTLSGLVRDTDTVGRLGGDEFLVVLGDVSGSEVAEFAARRILRELGKPVSYQESQLQVSASIGIAMCPEHGTTAESLRQAADAAMYKIKESGRDGFAFNGGAPAHQQMEFATADTLRNIRVLRGNAEES